MGWPSVEGYKDGQQIVADVLNKPLNQLAERTEFLKRLIQQHGSAKVVIDATVSDPSGGTEYPKAGQAVYRLENGTYAVATGVSPSSGIDEWFYASQSAMAVGVVESVNGTSAKIVLYGYLDLSSYDVLASTVISDTVPVSGRYYLSSASGKLTTSPNGPVIYIGDVHVYYDETAKAYKVSSMLVSPQYRDTGESHIHRSFVISGMPMGGYSVRTDADSRYHAPGIVQDDIPAASRSTTSLPTGLTIQPCGAWTYTGTDTITYKLSIVSNPSATGSGWSKYNVHWDSSEDGPGDSVASITTPVSVGSYGLKVMLNGAGTTAPSAFTGKYWTVTMPDAARAWVDYTYYADVAKTVSKQGFRLNLGMYPALARFVPPLPENGSALSVGGVDMRGTIFPLDNREWMVEPASSDGLGGPWLVWFGGDTGNSGNVSATAPFIWNADITKQSARNIVFTANRMRVGPTGFVTSLQPAAGAPIRITSTQTGADANQGALQISMDVDFTSSEDDLTGCQVVKKVDGTTFKTGPVVEKIVAGPGIEIDGLGQGTVTISAVNAVYSGDFETIALKNAKQDLAGGVFPYTKLLGWSKSSSSNVNTGFTAKFRVPDFIPYKDSDGNLKDYNVIVSASIFGEGAVSSDAYAAFNLTGYTLLDYTLNPDASDSVDYSKSLAKTSDLVTGYKATVDVAFKSGYVAFDPVVVHGFSDRDNPPQRQYNQWMLLRDNTASHNALVVRPGYFVGVNIERCAISSGNEYTAQLGFLSLRWNLVAAS